MDTSKTRQVNNSKIYIFTDEEQKLVNKAIQSYHEGRYLTSEEAEREIQEYLKD